MGVEADILLPGERVAYINTPGEGQYQPNSCPIHRVFYRRIGHGILAQIRRHPVSEEYSADFHEKLDADALLAIRAEAQDTIRNYDTKAEICGVGFILALGIVKQAGDSIPVPIEYASFYVLAGWLIIVIPIIMFALVLYPSRIDKIDKQNRPHNVLGVMYFNAASFPDVASYGEAARKSDWAMEILYEITKVSMIRDKKRTRFLRALYWAAGSFCVLFASQMVRANGVFH